MGVSLEEAQFDRSNASDDAVLATPSTKLPPGARAELAGADYARGSAMLAPGGDVEQARRPSPELADTDKDAQLSDSMLVGGIQPASGNAFMERVRNAGARHWYQGGLNGPQTGADERGELALPYDDTRTQAADIERVKRFGNYASGNTSWDEIEKEDPRGAAEIEELVPQFLSTAASGGAIYAHSGGGAATMAGLRRLIDTQADLGPARYIQVQGLEAVITEEQVASLGDAFAECGIILVVENTIAGPDAQGKLGSDTWNDMIAAGIEESGETPLVTHQHTGLTEGDRHINMVPALYRDDKMPERCEH